MTARWQTPVEGGWRLGDTLSPHLRDVLETTVAFSSHPPRKAPRRMLACVRTFALDGLVARAVTVEVDVRPGLPAFAVVGLGDAAVRESRERVQAAIRNSDFQFPAQRVTANLAPAHLPKVGPGFDLALACGVLAASGQLDGGRLEQFALVGELSLGGSLRACEGTLAVAEAARRAGLRGVIVPERRADEAALVPGLLVAGVADLAGAVRVLAGGEPIRARRPSPGRRERASTTDLADVRGQDAAVRACVVSAAGGHNLLLSGPPGVGKTMLAWRLPGLLPPLSETEALEVSRIESLTATAAPFAHITGERPFRAPHHSVTAAGLVGGANPRMPGEAVRAHHGVLFLDELSEFSRAALEALRQPLEDGRVAVVRAAHTAVLPARFMLVAATNPCPCGLGGDDPRCACTDADLARHRRRLSGALLDRIDVMVTLRRPTPGEIARGAATTTASARAAALGARERQARRLGGDGVNARMGDAELREHARLDHSGDALLARAHAAGLLSARAQRRVLRVARTLADLAASERVRAADVAEALALRRPPAGAAASGGGGAELAPARGIDHASGATTEGRRR